MRSVRSVRSDLEGGRIVLDDELDLFAGNSDAMLVQIKAGAGRHLLAGARKRAGQRHDHADFDLILRKATTETCGG
jgi:hypothetical protein